MKLIFLHYPIAFLLWHFVILCKVFTLFGMECPGGRTFHMIRHVRICCTVHDPNELNDRDGAPCAVAIRKI